jgi:hypothetical protein
MAGKMAAAMDGMATAMASLAGNVYAWPAESVTVPCIVVGYPTEIELDMTMARGGDRYVFPVWFVVGQTNNKDARDALSAILEDTSSVKSALDGAQTWGDCRVTSAEVAQLVIGAVTYLAAKFDAEIYA